MKQKTSLVLYKYWNEVRSGRLAPCRFEIEPAKIVPILPDTFIIEHSDNDTYKFRLAGTRICHSFGKELRGINILDLWNTKDKKTIERLILSSAEKASGSFILFEATTAAGRSVNYEMTILPLVQSGHTINRFLGCAAPMTKPFWLGTLPLTNFEITNYRAFWPDQNPDFLTLGSKTDETPPIINNSNRIVKVNQRLFRVYEGGRQE